MAVEYQPLLKNRCAVICYTLCSKFVFECLAVCLSVWPSVCLSDSASFALSVLNILINFLQTLYKSRYWGGVIWVCKWVNFVKKTTELWPLIDVQRIIKNIKCRHIH